MMTFKRTKACLMVAVLAMAFACIAAGRELPAGKYNSINVIIHSYLCFRVNVLTATPPAP